MDVVAQQVAAVQPLRYKARRVAGKPNLVVETGRDQPLKTISAGQVPTAITVLTPPLTPQVSFDAYQQQTNGDQPASFYNYLRVFYSFHPNEPVLSDAKESSITIPINQGDVVLVHSVQPNGWADGTLLSSGARGWLPTNYCRGYDHEHIRTLLTALTYVWEFIRGHEGDERSIFVRADYVRQMIAGVRLLLEQTGCLTRDSAQVQTNSNLRRLRKGLLGDLSAFAKGVKSLQDACQEAQLADEEFYPLLDAVVLKAFKVVTRAIRYLDSWILDVSPASGIAQGPTDRAEQVSQDPPLSAVHLPSPTNTLVATPNTASLNSSFHAHLGSGFTSPALATPALLPDQLLFPAAAAAGAGPTTTATSTSSTTATPGAAAAAAAAVASASPSQDLLPVPPSPATHHPSAANLSPSSSSDLHLAATSSSSLASTTATSTLPSSFSSAASPTASQPSTTLSAAAAAAAAAKRVSASHRLSYNNLSRSTSKTSNDLVSDRLATAHDAFLSNLGAFVGLHLQSRPSMELLVTTQQSVVACQALLNVVEAIYQRDFRRSGAVDESRLLMHAHLAELVHATKDILEATEAAGDEDVCLPEQGKRLMDAATMCVRSAGDCVAKSRSVIERIGDFEFDFHGLAFMEASTQPGSQQQHHHQHASYLDPAESRDVDRALPPPQTLRAPSPHHYSKRSSSLPPPREPMNPPPPPPTQPASPVQRKTGPAATNAKVGTWKQLPQPPSEDSSRASSFAQPESDSPTAAPKLTSNINYLTLDVDIPQTSFIDMEDTPSTPMADARKIGRSNSQGESFNGSTDTFSSRHKHSSGSTHASTRATTPEHYTDKDASDPLKASVDSLPDDHQAEEAEAEVMAENHAHELMHNKDGLIIGGSMPALIERLTTHDSTPDALFVTTFYLTFRLFTTPLELANTLIDRFDRTRDDSEFATPVRLRVYNVFKGWMEAYWQADVDAPALKPILRFATSRLQTTLPSAARRLIELSTQISDTSQGQPVSKLVSPMGRPRAISNANPGADAVAPQTNISKSQMNALKAFKASGAQCSILDLDPLEIARQLTLVQMKTFCAIQPDELLSLEWTKKDSNKATNVRAMTALSTDLANLVADTVLQLEAKKRATVIKQWVKIADKCYELGNYDALLAIICSLNSSMVLRLQKTWSLVSPKTLGKLDFLKTVVDCSRNYAVLRGRLSGHVAPCLPFLGIYLTDLTFIDAGNPATRHLPGVVDPKRASVINFDKHMKTARVITDLQRFQVPFKLNAIPEMQEWLEAQTMRVRTTEETNVQSYYKRSLLLEPREPGPSAGVTLPPSGAGSQLQPQRQSPPGSSAGLGSRTAQPGARERFEFWSAKHFPLNKEKVQS